MLSKDLILAKIKGNPLEELNIGNSDESDSGDDLENAKSTNLHDPYWCLMDTEGQIQDIPAKMRKLLKKRDWNSVSTKYIKDGEQAGRYMIVLKNYKEVPRDLKMRQNAEEHESNFLKRSFMSRS